MTRPVRHTLHRIPLLASLLGSFGLALAAPAALPPAPENAPWTLVEASKLDPASTAARAKDHLLVWRENNGEAASVVLRIELPFDKARLAVKDALREFGGLDETDTPRLITEMGAGWNDAIATLHPEEQGNSLRNSVESSALSPRFARAIEKGALLKQEPEWFRQAEQVRARLSGEVSQVRAFQGKKTPFWEARLKRSYGLFSGYSSTLTVSVTDAGFLHGRPVSYVEMQRIDERPNPRYVSTIQQLKIMAGGEPPPDYNILSGKQSKTLESLVVPGAEFMGVLKALEGSGQRVSVASSIMDTIERPPQKPSPAGEAMIKSGKAELLKGSTTPWASFGLASGMRFADILLTLPDGDLVIGADAFDDRSQGNSALLRLTRSGSGWRHEVLWRGAQTGSRARLSHDGKLLWLVGDPGPDAQGKDRPRSVYRIDLQTRKTDSWPLQDAKGEEISWSFGWALDADQRPISFNYDSAHYEDQPLALMHLAQASGKVERGQPVLRSPYADMSLKLIGQPRGQGVWVLDLSLAEIDPRSGRTLRAWRAPLGSDQGIHPAPLLMQGGAEAAVSFTVSAVGPNLDVIADDKHLAASAQHSGVQVIDLANGKPRFSVLAHPGGLKSVARSACGKWLALGGGSKEHKQPALLLDARTGQHQLHLDIGPEKSDSLRSLAFSWDGQKLWAIGHAGLIEWKLPAGLSEAHKAGCYPDQVSV